MAASCRPSLMMALRMQSTDAATSNNERLFPEELNLIFDSKCSVCKLEVNYLISRMKKVQERKGISTDLIRFTDLEDDSGYDESDPRNGGVTYEVGMASIHAIKPDGMVLDGVPVFREAYDLLGLGWVYAVTRNKVIGKLADKAYNIFARNRVRLTRGTTLEELIKARNKECMECQSPSQRVS